MKLPLSWITEIIDLNLPPHQIAKMLTLAGLEVDAFFPLPLGFENIVVGFVTRVEKHPDADKLSVAHVSDGINEYQVVCGAPNCREGIKTAFAMVGAKIQDEGSRLLKVKKTKLRGVESQGMLCSEKELGLGEDHKGIMEFADQFKEGADVAEIYGDTIFEISLTPNLGHCANVIGVARELSAATGKKVSLPKISVKEDSNQPISQAAAVEVLDSEKCPRYACRVIKDVKIGPSPDWLQKRLTASDFRPVNNIVDITNYVLLEMGHPLHAFDYDCVDGHKILVRQAKEGEMFVTLDEKERKLCADDLLICDQNKPVAIAGVMGGQNSEVSEKTTNILLEAAYFQATGIRRTSKRLGLQTESSKRFERGCDPNNVINALDRAAMLMQEIAGGKVCAGVVDVKDHDFPMKVIKCRLSRINKILGTKLSLSEVETVFQRLEMECSWDGQDLFTVKPPTYRVDIHEEIDLVEEVARIYGYENIPKEAPHFFSSPLPHAPIFLFENETRSHLISEGLQEFVTCDLIGPTLLDIVKESVMPEEAIVKVVNPTSIEQSILRTSLLPGMLQLAKYNYDRECHDIHGFEIGRIHFKKGEQYKEQSVAGVILSGKNTPLQWGEKPSNVDFYDLKGIVENLFTEIGAETFSFKNNALKIFHPSRQASVYVDGLEIGTLGEVHPAILRRLDIPQRIYFAELDLHNLIQVRKTEIMMRKIPIFPSSKRDLTITLKEEVPIQKIFDIIYSIPSKLLETVTLIDVYRSDKIGKENKNVTFHFVYRDKKKTIAQEAVESEHARISSQIESRI
ncbi:MAG: Phenylalanine--tRNA ligase beta subunit [Chlamydiae bacterium]|nr:Phenylalanine--tRNA ligase beta subunit [Chlamydiota bacterium]